MWVLISAASNLISIYYLYVWDAGVQDIKTLFWGKSSKYSANLLCPTMFISMFYY